VSRALELTGIHKRFGSVQALRGADFSLESGEVHALLGENGAGKSTLMHIAYGLVQPDSGEISVSGERQRIRSPRRARSLGIGMVHQHFTSIPALTVAENIALAAGWPVAPGRMNQLTRRLCERTGLPLEPDQRAGRLSVALKQRLEILKALACEVRVLLLDEPTGVLAPPETTDLFRMIRSFAEDGGAVVLITHKLDEALRAADRVTVLRAGAVTYAGSVTGQSVQSLTSAMIGQAVLPELGSKLPAPTFESDLGAELVRFDALEMPRESGYGIALRQASLVVRGGEILGIAAVEGNGQRELLRAIAGRLEPLRGRLQVKKPVGFIPEDRTTEGLISDFTLTENVVLGRGSDAPWIRGGRIGWKEAQHRTVELLSEYGIAASGPNVRAASLSGGNQQRLILARELSQNPAVIVAENPTRGLDVNAAAAIHDRLRTAAANGAAVIFHSADLDEVLQLANRVIVLVRGVISEVTGRSRAEVGALMLSGGGS
jgi:general nucleoside transport system ATP-binding protein